MKLYFLCDRVVSRIKTKINFVRKEPMHMAKKKKAKKKAKKRA